MSGGEDLKLSGLHEEKLSLLGLVEDVTVMKETGVGGVSDPDSIKRWFYLERSLEC